MRTRYCKHDPNEDYEASAVKKKVRFRLVGRLKRASSKLSLDDQASALIRHRPSKRYRKYVKARKALEKLFTQNELDRQAAEGREMNARSQEPQP